MFEDWLSRAEELVTRDSYGYTLKETEAYCSTTKVLYIHTFTFTYCIHVCISIIYNTIKVYVYNEYLYPT